MSDLVKIREAVEEDRTTINHYAAAEGMDSIPSIERVFVAFGEPVAPTADPLSGVQESVVPDDPDGGIAGFIRLVFDEDRIAHVNPVVVYPDWRGHGVGKQLITYAYEHFGELRLVSRGSSCGFYHSLGFEEVDWADIAPEIVEDCEYCDRFDECDPTPMALP